MSRRTLAAFDFDGTLTRRDTLVPFLATIAGRATLFRALGAESPRLALAAAGRGDRDLVKQRVLTRVLGGRSYAEVEAAGRAFGAELIRSAITTAGRDRIAWHLREGHEVVILSRAGSRGAAGFEPNYIGIPGEEADGVMAGIVFLERAYRGRPVEVGKNVIVLGSGYTAMDCASTSWRLGAEHMYVIVRRSRMPSGS